MNGSHLPAGQPMPGSVGAGGGGVGAVVGGRGPIDMASGSHTGSGGSRRRPQPQQYPQQYHPHHHQQQQHPMYHHSYMNPYANSYYPQMPPHYQNGAMPTAHYMSYNPYPQRSPPAMHQQYPPIVSSSMQPPPPQPYSRPPQQPSPAISTPPPYQPTAPPPQVPVPETPSSTHSSQVAPVQSTPPTPQTGDIAPTPTSPEVETRSTRGPFKYPLPWLSRPELPFPSRSARTRRRRPIMTSEAPSVELPTNQHAGESRVEESLQAPLPETPTPETATSAEKIQGYETPSSQLPTSEDKSSTSQATPISVSTAQTSTAATATPPKSTKSTSRAAVPAIPVVPVIPKASTKDVKSTSASEETSPEQRQTAQTPTSDKPAETAAPSDEKALPEAKLEAAPAPVKAAPKLWTGLFAKASPAAGPAASTSAAGSAVAGPVNGGAPVDGAAGALGGAGFAKANASSLAEALRAYRVGGGHKIAFLEPRGLINTGNMCYMNSVLQVLIFCIPFYDFLDQVSKKAAYSFKSETPLIDAMVNFMGEYKVIDSAVSVDQLRRRLKSEELEQYGEPFTPEFVYEAIRKLPRFASMRRGHQQDAEEFLGFLLEALHDECAHVMRHLPDSSTATTAANSSAATPAPSSPTSATDSNDWLEVGRKQRAAVTRSSGHPVASSPVTKIFGGQLRSELRVSGLKDSVTLEPFQPLQLDIGSPQVRNIVDALRGLTKLETLNGDFGSPRGKDAVATKQVFLESLPPVLILHLKRFQFDAEGTGTVKIWKKIGYPLELELPKEIFSRQKRNSFVAEGAGFPKYRLIAAVYHHGKNASGGHYTVDLRRQDGREWIRLDDTVIRRVRSEDVAEGGVEEDPKAVPISENKRDTASSSGNRFEGIGDDTGDEDGWNKVSAPVNGAKKWSSVVNGAPNASAAKAKPARDNIKDSKVAYLLFYQRA